MAASTTLLTPTSADLPLPAARIDEEFWTLVDEAAAWPLIWSETDEPVTSPENLTRLVSSLGRKRRRGSASHFGSLYWQWGTPDLWAQTMHVGNGEWIVETGGGSGVDFAHRVYRDRPHGYPQRRVRRFILGEFEIFGPDEAAQIMWAWCHGSLPAGYARTLNYLTPQDRRRYEI